MSVVSEVGEGVGAGGPVELSGLLETRVSPGLLRLAPAQDVCNGDTCDVCCASCRAGSSIRGSDWGSVASFNTIV